jgi:hypothetical protein
VKSENETSNSKAADSPQSGVRTLGKVAAVDSDHAAVGVVLSLSRAVMLLGAFVGFSRLLGAFVGFSRLSLSKKAYRGRTNALPECSIDQTVQKHSPVGSNGKGATYRTDKNTALDGSNDRNNFA